MTLTSLTSLGPEEIARRLFRYDCTAEALAGPDELDEAALDRFRRLGFVAIEGLLDPHRIEDAKQALSFLIAGGNPAYKKVFLEDVPTGAALAAGERELYVRKLLGFVNYEPRLAAIAAWPALLAIVERILGGPVRLLQDMALLKPALVGREKPWHQDAAYFLHDPQAVLGVWIALDAATADNGCMHVIPGSHLEGPRPHYHDRDCQLPDDAVAVERDVMVPLQPGGAMLFSGLLHHATPPNRSPDRRRALQFHYVRLDCQATDSQAHEQHFHDAGGYAACAVAHSGVPDRPLAEREPRG